MNMRDRANTDAHGTGSHPVEVGQVYQRVLAGASASSRYVEVGARGRVHLLEQGDGPPVVLLPGTSGTAGFFLPLLEELGRVRSVAVDRPGQGLSDPIEYPRVGFRDTVVGWLDRLLDTLELDTTALLGHSGGALWALWYALAHPDRVTRLVLLGPPTLPGSRCPLAIRLGATPVGELLSRVVPPSPKTVLQFAHHAARERETLARYPEQVDLFVAGFRDPVADRAARAELRVLVSPLSPSGSRRRTRVRPAELRRLAMPTLMIWGEHEPLGGAAVARAATELIPHGQLEVLPTGHGPWLGQPARTAAAVADFVRQPDHA